MPEEAYWRGNALPSSSVASPVGFWLPNAWLRNLAKSKTVPSRRGLSTRDPRSSCWAPAIQWQLIKTKSNDCSDNNKKKNGARQRVERHGINFDRVSTEDYFRYKHMLKRRADGMLQKYSRQSTNLYLPWGRFCCHLPRKVAGKNVKKEVAVDDRKTSGTEMTAFRRFAVVDFSGVVPCPSLFVSDSSNDLLVASKPWCSDKG